MPTYDYFCPANGRSVAALHGMSTTLKTWGELCDAEDLEPGATPADTPIEKLLGTGMVLTNSRAGLKENGRDARSTAGPTPQGGCCGGGCAVPG